MRGSYFHRAHAGHELKSRAHTTILIANRFSNEDGDASYEVDLPDGGLAILIGNVIEQGPNTQNSGIVTFAEEHQSNPMQALYLVNNTIVNDLGHGTFVRAAGSPTAFVSVNNLFVGNGTQYNGTPSDDRGNIASTDGAGLFVDRAGYDYHLADGASAIDAGMDPGTGGGMSLTPMLQYVHPTGSEGRSIVGSAIDVGAYEHGNVPPAGDGGTTDADGGVARSDGGTTSHSDGGTTSHSDGGTASHSDGGNGGDASTSNPGVDGGTGSTSGGCGCRVSSGGSSQAPLWLGLALALVVWRRRR